MESVDLLSLLYKVGSQYVQHPIHCCTPCENHQRIIIRPAVASTMHDEKVECHARTAGHEKTDIIGKIHLAQAFITSIVRTLTRNARKLEVLGNPINVGVIW